MQIFQSTLSQMAFLFTLIVLGYVLVKTKVVDANAAGVLSKLESWLFVPALVMGTFISKFTVDILQRAGALILFSFGIMVVILPLSIFLPRVITKDGYKQKIYTYGLAFANFGFMGNAVVEALYPEIFFEYLIFVIPLWILIYMWAVPVLLISDSDKNQTLKSRLKSFVNPMFICMIIGMVIGLLDIRLPAWTLSVINTCGDCMSPIAMILTGMTVAKLDLRRILSDKSIYVVTFIRLAVIPLAAIGILLLLPIDRTFFVCAICSLAMPLGLNTLVIPAAYGKDTSAAAGMALVSHLLSCISIPLVFLLMETIL
ncbi:MAG: AEC family transporter [Clostridia bacterium]|nr:AEC family transporter [Clostridia bacterium]